MVGVGGCGTSSARARRTLLYNNNVRARRRSTTRSLCTRDDLSIRWHLSDLMDFRRRRRINYNDDGTKTNILHTYRARFGCGQKEDNKRAHTTISSSPRVRRTNKKRKKGWVTMERCSRWNHPNQSLVLLYFIYPYTLCVCARALDNKKWTFGFRIFSFFFLRFREPAFMKYRRVCYFVS